MGTHRYAGKRTVGLHVFAVVAGVIALGGAKA
jgi:hypothetical protein